MTSMYSLSSSQWTEKYLPFLRPYRLAQAAAEFRLSARTSKRSPIFNLLKGYFLAIGPGCFRVSI